MEPYQQRVIEERKELNTKIVNLVEFIYNSETFDGLPELEQIYLRRQLYNMTEYSQVLADRVRLFKNRDAALAGKLPDQPISNEEHI